MAAKKDTAKHANKTTWGKGKSGNPGGRSPRVGPNGETWTQLLRTRTAKHEKRLHDLCMSSDPEIALKALTLWAPYAWGKPKEADGEGGDKPGIEQVLSQLIAKLPG